MKGRTLDPGRSRGRWTGFKGADPAGLRFEDSSKASMALPRLTVADFPTALIYELTGWFLSPTLSTIEPLVFWSNLSLVDWGCYRLQKCPQACMAPTLSLKSQMFPKRPRCTIEKHWLSSPCVQKSWAARWWKLGASLGSFFPLKPQEPLFFLSFSSGMGTRKLSSLDGDLSWFRCEISLDSLRPKASALTSRHCRITRQRAPHAFPWNRQWVTGSWLPWALLSNWTFYEETTEWLMFSCVEHFCKWLWVGWRLVRNPALPFRNLKPPSFNTNLGVRGAFSGPKCTVTNNNYRRIWRRGLLDFNYVRHKQSLETH